MLHLARRVLQSCTDWDDRYLRRHIPERALIPVPARLVVLLARNERMVQHGQKVRSDTITG